MSNCEYCSMCKKYKNNSCEKDTNGFCLKAFKMDKLLDLSLLGTTQKKEKPLGIYKDINTVDYDNYIKLGEYKDNIEDFVKSGKNIYIYSKNTGNGKTSWAAKLLIHYINSIWYKCDVSCHALFINIPRFLLALKSFIDDKNDEYILSIKKNVLNADIVVWDDIATKNMTEFEKENVLSIINARLDSGKSNIFTSNVQPQILSDLVGSRLASRIMQSEKIEFNGPDLRGVQA